MATTYEEISTCPKANREFWSEWARFYLSLYREHRKTDPDEANWDKHRFRLAMLSRRNAEYLEPPTGDKQQ